MAKIEVNYEAIEQDTIPAMQRAESDIEALYNHVDKAVKSLKGYMEAESAEAYVTEFESLLGPDIKKLEELTSEYYQQLQQVVKNFADLDKEMHDMISF